MVYRLYIWRLEKKDSSPARTAIVMIGLTQYLQLVTLYAFVTYFLPVLRTIHVGKWQGLIILAGLLLGYHLIVYNNYEYIVDTIEMARRWSGPVVVDIVDELPHGFLNFVRCSSHAGRFTFHVIVTDGIFIARFPSKTLTAGERNSSRSLPDGRKKKSAVEEGGGEPSSGNTADGQSLS